MLYDWIDMEGIRYVKKLWPCLMRILTSAFATNVDKLLEQILRNANITKNRIKPMSRSDRESNNRGQCCVYELQIDF